MSILELNLIGKPKKIFCMLFEESLAPPPLLANGFSSNVIFACGTGYPALYLVVGKQQKYFSYNSPEKKIHLIFIWLPWQSD